MPSGTLPKWLNSFPGVDPDRLTSLGIYPGSIPCLMHGIEKSPFSPVPYPPTINLNGVSPPTVPGERQYSPRTDPERRRQPWTGAAGPPGR